TADADVRSWLYQIAFLQKDDVAMQRYADFYRTDSNKANAIRMLWTEGNAAASRGAQKKRDSFYQEAFEAAQQNQFTTIAAQILGWQGIYEADVGDNLQARKLAARAVALSRGRDVLASAGVALALSVDTRKSQVLVDELAERFPLDTLAKSVYVPTCLAVVAINDDKPVKAIQLLQAAIPYEFTMTYSYLPIYIRGQAYLKMK